MREIVSEDNKLIENFVCCEKCKAILDYDTKKGTKKIKNHMANCKQRKIDSFVQKRNINFSKDEKDAVIEAAMKFCYKDIRPFHAVKGDGLIDLLVQINAVSTKYGRLSRDEIEKYMPVPNTVCIWY